MTENLPTGAEIDDVAPFKDERDQSSRLFDLRYLIGAMLTLYGVILIIVGIGDSSAEIARASGIRINLWMGIMMTVVGVFFLAWARLRPLRVEGLSAAAEAELKAAAAERPGAPAGSEPDSAAGPATDRERRPEGV